MSIEISQHAYDRAKKRLSISRSSLTRMADNVYSNGIKHCDTSGKLNKYISKLYFEHKTANNIRIYGEFVWVFCGNVLVTLYQIPNDFKKIINKIKSKNGSDK